MSRPTTRDDLLEASAAEYLRLVGLVDSLTPEEAEAEFPFEDRDRNIRDALAAVAVPLCEVHISNVHAREEFRRHSFLADLAVGVMAGFGPQGYSLAMAYVVQRLAPAGR